MGANQKEVSNTIDLTRIGLTSRPALRWKGQFILADDDPTVPHSNEGLLWCLHTQTCIGPDGELAEPGNCCSAGRVCHKTGNCE